MASCVKVLEQIKSWIAYIQPKLTGGQFHNKLLYIDLWVVPKRPTGKGELHRFYPVFGSQEFKSNHYNGVVVIPNPIALFDLTDENYLDGGYYMIMTKAAYIKQYGLLASLNLANLSF